MLSLLTGLALGLVLSVLGAGGGIIAVPALLLLDLTPGAAMGSALGVVFAAAAPAAIAHARAKRVELSTLLFFGPPSMLGAVLGAKLNTLAPERLVYGLFALVLLLATASLFFPMKKTEGTRAPKWLLITAGLGLGVLTGFLGVGGGFLIVPALVMLARLPLHRAVGTSTALIAVTSLSGATAAVVHHPANALLVLPIAAGAMTGALLGAPLSGRISPGPLRAAFASLALVIASVMSWKALG